MARAWSRIGIVVVAVWALLACSATVATAQSPVTDERLLNADKDPNNWLTNMRTLNGWRYSPLTQITPSNVNRLVAKWSLQLGELGDQQATPLVNDGVMYIPSSSLTRQRVFAVNAANGSIIWTYERKVPEDVSELVRFLPENRGVALYENTVIMGTLDSHLIALDSKTGKQVWDIEVADYRAGYHLPAAPLVAKGKVVLSISGGDVGARCFVQAHDARTGRQLWRTYTIPGPGEPGNETWAGDSWEHGGGAVWLTGTYDAESNQVFFGTGNPTPWPSQLRPGANLWTDSVIALDLDTGKMRWGIQHLANDPWDLDTQVEPMVIDVNRGGRTVKAVVQANKLGYVYTMNRLEGKLESAAPFITNMNIWKGHEPGTGKPIPDYENKPTMGGKAVEICPSVFGATGWAYKTYSPKTGMYYIPAQDMCMRYSYTPEVKWTRGLLYLGAGWETFTRNPQAGHFKAFNVHKNELAWEWKTAGPFLGGGAVSTGGNVVFYGTSEGFVVALDATNGREMWRFNMGTPLSGGTMTYAVGGKQFVAAVGGGSASAIGWMADPTLAFMQRVPLGNVVTVFGLPD